MSKNPIVHWELMGANGQSQRDFYSAIFDWTLSSPEGFDSYFMTSGDDMGVNGAVGQGGEEMPSYQTIYVQVDDIDSKLAEIEDAGGQTVMPRTVIPDTVTFGMFKDPAGNLVGLVEPD